jgi:hypothetical protein
MVDNPDEHRAKIDRGETHDKVDFPDPAAAPLGTDSEAGGSRQTEAHDTRAGEARETAPTSGPAAPGEERARTISGEMKDSLGIGKAAMVGAGAVLLVLVLALVARAA